MQIFDFHLVSSEIELEYFQFKLIANERGVVFLPRCREHRDSGCSGIRYADNYAGNALAAMVTPGLIEFRYHRDFPDDRVCSIAERIITHSDLTFAAGFRVTYQNRVLVPRASGQL